MNGWTIIYGTTEKSFSDWGLKRPRLSVTNQGRDVFTMQSVGFDATPIFPYEALLDIRHNGTRHFLGSVSKLPTSGSSKSEVQSYEVSGPWWDLELTQFQQQYATFDSRIEKYVMNPNLASTHVFLGQTLYWGGYQLIGASVKPDGWPENIIGAWSEGAKPYGPAGTGWPTTLPRTVLGIGVLPPKDNVPKVLYQISAGTEPAPTWWTGPWDPSFGSFASPIPPASIGQTIGDAIRESLLWAIQHGVQIATPQTGDIDLPTIVPPTKELRDQTCATFIQRAMEYAPDAVCWWDYSGALPRFRAQSRVAWNYVNGPGGTPVVHPGLPAISFTIGKYPLAEVPELNPRFDRVVPSVMIALEQTNNVNGNDQFITVRQVYGPTTADHTSSGPVGYASPATVIAGGVTGYERGAMFATIDLKGFSMTTVSGQIVARKYDATSFDWWSLHHKWLGNDRIKNSSIPVVISNASITLQDGTPVGIYGQEMVSGQWAPWMRLAGGVACVVATAIVKAKALIAYLDEFGTVVTRIEDLATQIQVTNAPAVDGTVQNPFATTTSVFSTVASFVQGEIVPENLAQWLYQQLSVLHYSGSIKLQSAEVTDWLDAAGITGKLGVGFVLNLLGSAQSSWATMAALIQGVEEDLESGETVFKLGPPEHLSPSTLVALLQVNRYRYNWTNPLLRSTGQFSDSGQVQLGQETSRPESNSGLSGYQNFTAAFQGTDGSFAQVFLDATKPTVIGQPEVKPLWRQSWSNFDKSKSCTVEAWIGDLLGPDGKHHDVKYRRMPVCYDFSANDPSDTNGPVEAWAWFLCSKIVRPSDGKEFEPIFP